jgi:hypothetical protein
MIYQLEYSSKKFRRLALLFLTSQISFNPLVAQALSFNFNPEVGMSQQAIDGFIEAGNIWSSLLSDSVTINIDIGFSSLGAGILAEAGSEMVAFYYSNFRHFLSQDITSPNDLIAVSNLPTTSTFDIYLNLTSNNPNGSGSILPYLDNDDDINNQVIRMTRANAKALGMISSNHLSLDASITFSSDFNFDFDRSDGITSNTLDFVGIAIHEIGHALGFISGVDILDFFSQPANGGPYPDNAFTYVSPLDLFRYSDASFASGVIDWTADAREKYFSIDGGQTKITTFSTGDNFGDGWQASHWKDNLGIGIMDPTTSYGEFLTISQKDLLAFDVIGWNLQPDAIPFEFSPGLGIVILTGFYSIKEWFKRFKK